MYIPKEFIESDQQEILRFMDANPLGIIISTEGVSEPLVSHVPFVVGFNKPDQQGVILESHLSRANAQANHLKTGDKVLVIFQGSNTYISSSVYTHTNVPTWNYQAVHAYGTVEMMTTAELVTHLEESVSHFEA